MGAATITEYVNIPDPNVEVVILELTDGETYTSKKFTTVKHVSPSWAEDTDGDINYTVSGNVVTINAAGASDSAISLELRGVKN